MTKGGVLHSLMSFFSSPPSYDSTRICATLHLACWLQMLLPDFFSDGAIWATLRWSSIESKYSVVVFFWEGISLFFFMCRPLNLEPRFKRMAQQNGKPAFGQCLRFLVRCPTKSLMLNNFKK